MYFNTETLITAVNNVIKAKINESDMAANTIAFIKGAEAVLEELTKEEES